LEEAKYLDMENGYEIIDNFIDQKTFESMSEEINRFSLSINKGGIRNPEKLFNSVNTFAKSKFIYDYAGQFLLDRPKLVRAIVFIKTKENNWSVPWHQDKTVAVSHKFLRENWCAWSIKDNIHHVQPPSAVMEDLISIRIHLNSTDRDNGCLKVIPRSHKTGVLNQKTIQEITNSQSTTYCEASEMSALVMRPLLLHSSEKAVIPTQRRVLHLEYSSYQLPPEIVWG